MNRLLCAGVLLALTAAAAPASAQPGLADDRYAEPPPPPPPPPMVRSGLTLGFNLAAGSMSAESGPIRCDGCGGEPVAGGAAFWIGGMVSPRFAVLLRGSITGRALDADGIEVLWNSTALIAGKYWLSPRLWIEGGLGFADLSITYDDGFEAFDEDLDEGSAGLLGVGFEALHAPRFALDLSLTVTASEFDDLDDTIHTALLGLGFNWY